MPRSGTNLLATLLALHPDTRQSGINLWEDHVLSETGLIKKYVDKTSSKWEKKWEVDKNALSKKIGDGISGFLSEEREGTVISKTPFPNGLENFRDYFPEEKLILIVRDGRDAIASGVKTFGWNFRKSARQWARNVTEYYKLLKDEKNTLIVHFEDLVTKREICLRSVVLYCQLDPEKYPWDNIDEHPVYGSSDQDLKDWSGSKKAQSDFNPVGRHLDWNQNRKARFDFLAGESLRHLNYAWEKPKSELRYYLANLRDEVIDLFWPF